MKTNSNLIRTACLLAFTGATAWAQAGISDAAYNNAKEQLKAAYKVERDACNTQAGNAKDICVETAKGRENVALAHLQVQHTGAQKDMVKLAEARYDARFEVAKEVCDDRTGNDKDVCMKEAKAMHEKAKAEVKMNKEIREARNEAEETKMKADYKVAAERCDSLTSDAKDACVATAKARFGQ